MYRAPGAVRSSAAQLLTSLTLNITLIRKSILQKGYKAFRVFFKKIMVHFPRFNIISSEGKYGESSLKMHLRTPHLSSEYEYIYISCNQGWFDKVRIASRVDLDFTLTRLRLQSLPPQFCQSYTFTLHHFYIINIVSLVHNYELPL